MKVVKATAQVLNTLWQYRDLRTIYKKVRLRLVAIAHDLKSIFDVKDCKYQRVRK